MLRRFLRRLSLTRRFLIVSAIVIATATAGLGVGISYFVRQGVTEGIARTSASSLDSLVSSAVNGMVANDVLTPDDRDRLDRLFEISSDAETTRLIQIRIFQLDGRVLYEASDGVVDTPAAAQFNNAKQGLVSSDIVELPLDPGGPFGSHTLTLLRLYTPLHEPGTGEVFAVAALYYSATALLAVQWQAQVAVWSIVLIIGLLVIAALYLFVASASRTITRQAGRLSANLAESRRLADEIRALHVTSEQLRTDAIEANEQLLARVGADIHDGPLQLLTLVILQMTRAAGKAEPPPLATTAGLAADAVDDLRNISAGLVLPELAELTLADTIALAIRQYEGATGTQVDQDVDSLDYAMERDIQICVYRVVQESLNNAFRHSGGLDQSVRATRLGDHIELAISNTKRQGAMVEEGLLRPKLGLRGMRLRVEAVGGALQVEMGEAKVVIRARIPSRTTPVN